MKNKTSQAFKVIDIFYPKIDFNLGPRSIDGLDLKQAFRGNIVIKDSKNIVVRFGVGLFESREEGNKNDTSFTKAIVEVTGIIEFKIALDNNIKGINDIPLIANILALLYPFLREKINYCFSNNKITMLLPPLNVIDLLKNVGDSFDVIDARNEINVEKLIQDKTVLKKKTKIVKKSKESKK